MLARHTHATTFIVFEQNSEKIKKKQCKKEKENKKKKMIREYIVEITNDFQKDAFERFEDYYSPMRLIRCKDCKNKKAIGNKIVCTKSGDMHLENFFCGYAEPEE